LRMGGGYCAHGRGQEDDAFAHLLGGGGGRGDELVSLADYCLSSPRFHDIFIRSHLTVVFGALVLSKAMAQADVHVPSSAMFTHMSDRIEKMVLDRVVERVRRHADPLR
jgi:hypothetical protein